MKTLGQLLKITGLHEEKRAERTRRTRTVRTENTVLRVKIEDVFTNPFQPRKQFDQGAVRIDT